MSESKTHKQVIETEPKIVALLDGFTVSQSNRILDLVRSHVNAMSVVVSDLVIK